MLLALLWSVPVYADTHTAASCSAAHIQTAIDAASDGDIVVVPAGTCAWTSVVVADLTAGGGRSLTIQGAGIGQTIISDTINVQSVIPLTITTAPGKSFRLTGFTFDGANQYPNDTCSFSFPTSLCHDGMVFLGGTSTSIRVDHNAFVNVQKRALYLDGAMHGVVDHNSFIKSSATTSVQTITQFGDHIGAWAEPTGLGGSNFVFYEDNSFDYNLSTQFDSAFDAGGGARFVIRHNAFKGTAVGWHGTGSGGYRRGTRAFEVYSNTFTPADSRGTSYAVGQNMGGTGLIYNNTVGTGVNVWNLFTNMRTEGGSYDFWDTCDGRRKLVCSSSTYVHACSADADCAPSSQHNEDLGTCTKHLCKSPSGGSTWTQCSTNTDCTGALGAGYTCDGYFDGDRANGANSSGTATCGTCSTTQMSVSGTPWTTNQWAGFYLYNESDKTGVDASRCLVASNTASTITCNAAMAGGTSNTWSSSNAYTLTNGWPCRDQIGVGQNNELEPVYGWGNTELGSAAQLNGGGTYTYWTASRDFYTATTYNDLAQKPTGYTAYTYPHPLTGEAPSAPINVRIR